ncbi:MAG: hypothetical protein JSS11_00210 [Verrucomicrobia bacterium]|nr:hypothetical protein [Verrucomicrobiota bacterium]
MTARAKYLAKVLLTRMATLENAARKDAARRQELVAKVLLAEVGVSDFSLSNLVMVAMPDIVEGRATTTRELDELARFLDQHVAVLRD